TSRRAMVKPAAMARFHLFQALLLLRCEIRRNLAMRFGNRIAHAPAGIASNLFELRARLFDDRRNLGQLLISQFELPLETVLHRLSGKTVLMCAEEVMR